MLARTPFVSIRVRPTARQRKLNRDRQRVLVDRIADLMRAAEPTAFAAEGPCRSGIRSSLCLQAWPWKTADAVAAEITHAALNIARAKRPSWYEGQPDWTRPGALPIERERCANCNKRLPDLRPKFCCDECKNFYHGRRRDKADREQKLVKEQAYRAAWSARQPARTCETCGKPFQPRSRNQKLCSRGCNTLMHRVKSVAP